MQSGVDASAFGHAVTFAEHHSTQLNLPSPYCVLHMGCERTAA